MHINILSNKKLFGKLSHSDTDNVCDICVLVQKLQNIMYI